ncbi:MAG: RNA 2',3'-cyclic phosphodiesterase [Lachnospiraceae bacterium]|nr:RNA 2',3'-cyclic phosphodiesterase [Lachnospiraceae bacterium]
MRLFIAIELEDRIKDELCMIQKRVKLQGMKGNFTTRENMHLTLAFIGEYSHPEHVSDALDDVLFEPMKLALDGFGCFKDLYWIGIKEDKGLTENVKRIRKALADNGIPFDRKKFVPHITLARKIEYDKALPTDCPFPAAMDVEYISLMRSDRGKNGMIYTPVANFFL